MPSQRHTYLREIELKYKITKIADKVIGKRIDDPKTIADIFSHLQYETKEKLIAVSLDSKGQILCYEVVAVGSVRAVHVRPAEVFRSAIVINAASVVLVHNHPSGSTLPSTDDIAFTSLCRRLAHDLGIKLHDHVIVGVEGYHSFVENGMF